jgi:hypothetical protein
VLVVPVQYPLPQPEDDGRIDESLEYARGQGLVPLWAAGNGFGRAPLPPSDTVPGSSSDDALTGARTRPRRGRVRAPVRASSEEDPASSRPSARPGRRSASSRRAGTTATAGTDMRPTTT